MNLGYFLRVTKQSPTRLWINNPTRKEADLAIAAGAISCTTNPAYAMKMLQREEQNYITGIIDEAIKNTRDQDEAADLIQQKLVKSLLDIFLSIYKKAPGKQGFVSIQGDPYCDKDANHIYNEALRHCKLGKNLIVKIPATKAGLEAIEALIAEDVPIIATEVMSIAQAVYTCEMFQRVSKKCGKYPAFYLTHITGIFDEHLQNVVKRDNIKITQDLLCQAGCIVARKQYKILKERKYPGIMLGGGARGLHHFTEFVGSDMHITINWEGSADKLIESDPPVIYRINTPTPQYVIDELLEKLPDFRKAYFEDGLTINELADYGPIVLFRNSFIKGWDYLLKTVEEQRK